MKYIFTMLLVTSLIACASNGSDSDSKNVLLSGTIANTNGGQIFLDQYTFTQGQKPVDTATVSADGSFTFEGKLNENGFYLVRFNQANWLVFLDGGKVNFSADANAMQYKTEGDAEAAIFANFISKASENQQQLTLLNQKFQQSRMTGNLPEAVSIQQQYTALYEQHNTFINAFADTVRNPLMALFAVSILNTDDNIETIEKTLAKAGKEIPNSSYYTQLKEKIENATKLAVGRKAPEFQLKSPQGETLPLSATQGKVVLLDFWASWCRPCRVENPNLVRMYDKYKGKGFEIYSVSLDQNMQKWVAAIQQDNLKWKYHGSNLLYWQCPVAKQYEVSSIPQTFLLDREGKIIARNLRGQALEQKLEEIFGS